MESQELDKQIKLLMLMHEWLEEAQRPQQAEPQLEFHADPSRLIVWVAMADVSRGKELRYEAGNAEDHLRELEASGDIRLSYSEDSRATGIILFTDEGLQKVQYYRNMKSNLPRRSGGWYISLLGGEVGLVVQTLWRANWEGREISVRNRQHMSIRSRMPDGIRSVDEYLNVDSRFPENYELTKGRFAKDFFGKLRANGLEHTVHAHIGITTPWMTTGCRIAINDVVIGGDTRKTFLT